MLYHRAMSAFKPREKKDQQMNVRFTAGEIAALDAIAEIEDRDRAYLVGFFTRWGMEQYRRVGSLVILRKRNVPGDARLTQMQSSAVSRLRLREEADSVREHEDNGGASATTKKPR